MSPVEANLATALDKVGPLRRFTLTAGPDAMGAATFASGVPRADQGVAASPAAGLIDLLAARLGPLALREAADDARGGAAAEARYLLAGEGFEGTLTLSRLRPILSVLRLEGEGGIAEVDLSAWRVSSTADAPPAPARRSELLQPWEDPGPTAPGPLAGRKVLVVGATGFIGARLTEMLADGGAEVTAGVRSLARAVRIARRPVRLAVVDLGKPDQIAAAVAGQEVVINLAHDFDRSGARNLAGYEALVEAAVKAGATRFVHVSSIAAYDAWPRGDIREDLPRDGSGHAYKETKRAAERDLAERAAASGFSAAVVQPTLVYGPFSKQWTDHFADMLAGGGTVVLPDEGRGLCNAVYVDDVAQALILAAASDAAGAPAYIASAAAPVTWADFIGAYANAVGGKVALEAASPGAETPRRRMGLGSLVGVVLGSAPSKAAQALIRERLGDAVLAKLKARLAPTPGGVHRPGDAEPDLFRAQGVCAIDKARAELGYAPRFDLEAGMARTAAYLSWKDAF